MIELTETKFTEKLGMRNIRIPLPGNYNLVFSNFEFRDYQNWEIKLIDGSMPKHFRNFLTIL